MTLEILQAQVREAISTASSHAKNCSTLIADCNLAGALEYCKTKNLEPPQCSMTAISENASRLRAVAARKLSDPHWWEKALKTRAIRTYEANQIVRGNVLNFISDELAVHHEKHKGR